MTGQEFDVLFKKIVWVLLFVMGVLIASKNFVTRTETGARISGVVENKLAYVASAVGAKDAAIQMRKNAIQAAPTDLDLKVDALKALMAEKQWMEAWQVADALRVRSVNDPEIRLLCARAFLNAGDRPMAEFSMRQARELLEHTGLTPEWRRDYEDLLLAFPPDKKQK
jgi:hypothetical protein